MRGAAIVVALVLAGCGGAVEGTGGTTGRASAAASDTAGQRYPDIVGVAIMAAGEDTFDLTVTVSSPYDSPDRYADGWRVLAPDGTELGTHTVTHDHAGEQPFTRTQTGVRIPADIDEVTVEGRDQRYGYGGSTATTAVPHEAG